MPQQSIEHNLERIADALETVAKHLSHLGRLSGIQVGEEAEAETTAETAEEIAAAKKARAKAEKAASKKAAKEAEAAAADEDDDDEDDTADITGDEDDDDDDDGPPTKEQVKKALQTFMSSEGKEKAIAILKKHGKGAENLSQLKEKFFAKVMDALGDPVVKDEDEDEDDD